MHLPLPRAVGNYQVIRTTQVVDLAQIATTTGTPISKFLFFAPIESQSFGATTDERWISSCGIAGVGASVGGINAAYGIPMDGIDALGLAATLVPSALTVQVMNPGALQSESGIAYIGRSSAQYDLAGSARTWDQLGNQFVQFMAPRLCAAGKLVLRGVKVSSYPLDMSALSSFRPIRGYVNAYGAGGVFNWTSDVIKPQGFAPIVIYNPNSIALQILVTMEWRVRFDPENPASSSHTYHGTATDAAWAGAVNALSSAGHGVVDIVEDMAEGAATAGGVAMAASRLAPLLA
jgi:hypothetical protein